MLKTLHSGILAGICISLGGAVYLNLGGIAGAVLFSFGLLTVVHFKYKLYTGTAGFIDIRKSTDWSSLGIIITGNIIGCFLTALLVKIAMPSCIEAADRILMIRLNNGIIRNGLLGIGCGFIMTASVKFAREGRFLPLLFGVPLFILCGFTHSIADAFYYLTASATLLIDNALIIIPLYISIIIGNFIGCNLSRLLLPENY